MKNYDWVFHFVDIHKLIIYITTVSTVDHITTTGLINFYQPYIVSQSLSVDSFVFHSFLLLEVSKVNELGVIQHTSDCISNSRFSFSKICLFCGRCYF